MNTTNTNDQMMILKLHEYLRLSLPRWTEVAWVAAVVTAAPRVVVALSSVLAVATARGISYAVPRERDFC